MRIPFCEGTKRCNFDTMAKARKKRASNYDEKLAMNGTFEEVNKSVCSL
jgi:hypothetical protein